jgi:hypothetical protein
MMAQHSGLRLAVKVDMICLENAVLDRMVLSWPHIGHGHNLKWPEPCYFEDLELGRKDRDGIAATSRARIFSRRICQRLAEWYLFGGTRLRTIAQLSNLVG